VDCFAAHSCGETTSVNNCTGNQKKRNKMEDTRNSSNKKGTVANVKVKPEVPQ
jgi:hypothetical protein